MSELHYDTLLLRREGMTRDVPAGDNEDLRWVANSATLIYGDQDAVLVDTFMTIGENQRLVDWVRTHGRNLTHIFLTHGHGDHVYGVGQLLEAFPGAQAVATAGTVAEARREAGDDYRDGLFGRLFPGQIPLPAIPTELTSETIRLEDHELRVIDTGHTDTMATSVLWCPSLRLLVAGTWSTTAHTCTSPRRAPPRGENGSQLSPSSRTSTRCASSRATSNPTAPTTRPTSTSRSST